MVLKGLSVIEVSRAARVPYNTASGILNGRLVHPAYLQRIINAIEKAPELLQPVA